LVTADEEGNVVDGQGESVEKRLHRRILVDVQVDVRLPVAGEELPDAKRAGRVRRSNQHRVALRRGDERHAPEDEGPEKDLAQLRVGLDELTQGLGREREQLAVLAHPASHQAAAPR
jgi:hypothetical protein